MWDGDILKYDEHLAHQTRQLGHFPTDIGAVQVQVCEWPGGTMRLLSRDKVDELLGLWGEGGLEDLQGRVEGVAGERVEHLRCEAVRVVSLTTRAEGRGTQEHLLLDESGRTRRERERRERKILLSPLPFLLLFLLYIKPFRGLLDLIYQILKQIPKQVSYLTTKDLIRIKTCS